MHKVRRKSHWRNFTLVASPGFGVRGARWSRRRRREHRGAKGAKWGGVWGGMSAPQPTRRSGGASWALRAGSGAQPRPLSHFLHILGHRTLLVARKNDSLANSTLKKWWWQSPPLSKVVVTSHHRHIQSCAYGKSLVLSLALRVKSLVLALALRFLSLLTSVASLPASGPWAPPAERGPSLESIYRVSLTVDVCEGNKIISLKKLFHHSQLGPSKIKKSGGPGHVPTVPIG